ncbi:hypothetical protein EDF38_2150 [Frigoribacterium sp. PhB160]|uniref:hypothetical protein n=1 Tax=Frigoribacterium sp. PhB160 TaxID=2485192 RepID=UPI000F4AEA73|nr:hypothetical protein [Frigoribacterium sp. PhB160]ROS59304.1 hypothetical protein EDF38_2150 [Frigoribacterium sp. PhB160]
MSGVLEQRYRRLLGWYPRSWRERHGDAMVGTLLDVADAQGRHEPTWSESVDLARGGLAARLGVVVPEAVRDGAAAVALATGTAFSLVYVLFVSWAPLVPDGEAWPTTSVFGPFTDPGVVLGLLWATAAALWLVDDDRVARGALVVLLVVLVGLPLTGADGLALGWDGPTSTNLGFQALLAVLALVGTPRRRARLALATLVWAVAFSAVYLGNGMLGTSGAWFWASPAQFGNLALGGLLAVVAAFVLAAAGRATAALVTLASLAPWAGVAAVQLVVVGRPDAFSLAVAAVAVALAVATVGLARRRSRRERAAAGRPLAT